VWVSGLSDAGRQHGTGLRAREEQVDTAGRGRVLAARRVVGSTVREHRRHAPKRAVVE